MFRSPAKRQVRSKTPTEVDAKVDAKVEVEPKGNVSPAPVLSPKPIRIRQRKGLYHDGVWKCNCNPRKQAVKRQVRKNGPNQGLWFWTCVFHKEQPESCGFFMWESEAKAHEQGGISPSPSVSPAPAPRTPSKPKPKPQQHTPATTTTTTTTTAGTRKRSRNSPASLFISSHTPSIQRVQGWLLTDPFEEEEDDAIFATAPPSPSRNEPSPMKARRTAFQSSPSKAQSLMYPRLPSFVSDVGTVPDDDIFACPPTVPRHQRAGLFNAPPGAAAGGVTSPEKMAIPLVREVVELLDNDKDCVIPEPTRTQLIDILAVHAMRYDGVVLGRDATRKTVVKMDAKILELKGRLLVLEEGAAAAAAAAKKPDSAETQGPNTGRGCDGLEPRVEDWNVQSSLNSRADSTQISTAVPPFGHRYTDL